MALVELDTKGLQCPRPILKIAAIMPKMKKGDVLKVYGDCQTFEEDVRKWCSRMNKVLIVTVKEGDTTVAEIQF